MPIQINQEQCLRCERCLRACRANAIFFKNSIRLVDYAKCKACLSCVQVCPRNAIVVSSVEKTTDVLTVKIEHDTCNMCLECTDDKGEFCPNNLFYVDKIKKGKEILDGIRFKFKEVGKCQGCLKCELSCPENAMKPVKYEEKEI